MFGIPENGIGMEILCRVEPEMELLLSVSLSLTEHIGMQCIWISAKIPKELKVNLIMCRSLRRKLHYYPVQSSKPNTKLHKNKHIMSKEQHIHSKQ